VHDEPPSAGDRLLFLRRGGSAIDGQRSRPVALYLSPKIRANLSGVAAIELDARDEILRTTIHEFEIQRDEVPRTGRAPDGYDNIILDKATDLLMMDSPKVLPGREVVRIGMNPREK
jgi:hypothetical protein